MTTIDANELVARACAIEKAGMLALTTPVTCDAVPRFFHTQEAFPYWTHRLGPVTGETDGEDGEDFENYAYELIARLVIGHITSGYKGENETNLYTYIPHMMTYFNARELLQSAAYPLGQDYLIRARVTGVRGYTEFKNSSTPVMQVGTEFTVRCEFEEEITQAYL